MGVPNRYRRYLDSTSVPAYTNLKNLTGNALELDRFSYYCSSLSNGIITDGLVQMYTLLQSYGEDSWDFIDINK